MLPLGCIVNQQCWIITGGRSLVIDGGMATFKIVGMYIFANRFPCLADIGILGQICFLILKTAEPSFNHDIICPMAFSIHALTDVVLLEKIYIFVACKLASLIRIQDNWFCCFKRFFQCIDNHSGIQGIIEFPAYNAAAVPVDYSCQIQESTLDGDVSDVD